MPYVRIYSQDVPLEQKRFMTQKLIDITLRALQLRAEERNRITIQFLPQTQGWGSDRFVPAVPPGIDFTLEVMGHDLTEEKKRAFTEEATSMIAHLAPLKPRSLITRLLRAKADTRRQIALQFNDLSPAISDPFIVEPEDQAA
jgi:hypothetical protein